MGPLSHTYVSTKVTGRKNSLLILGSILPDIAWSSNIKAWRDKLHNSPEEFYNSIQKNYPQLIELAVGVKLHCYKNRGADYYSDDEKVGFAKIEAPKLSANVARLLDLERKGLDIPWKHGLQINSNSWLGRFFQVNQKIAFILAHNFIEFGVDLNLLETHKEVVAIYKNAFNNLDLGEVITFLSHYLKSDERILEKELENYIKLINPLGGFSSVNRAVNKGILLFLEGHLRRKLDSKEVKKILEAAKKITKETYLIFLNRAVDQMKPDFRELI